MLPVKPPRIILASRSPRRAALLRDAGLSFTQMAPPFDDPPHPGAGSAREVAAALALQKLQSIPIDEGHIGSERPIVITADTLIAFPDGSLAGTPRDVAEARSMIGRFVGNWHDVVTGVALRGPGQDAPEVFTQASGVYLDALADAELEAYLTSGAWSDKAGGYNLFDRERAGWPLTVRGDRSNVVGLPMGRLMEKLARWGITAMVEKQP